MDKLQPLLKHRFWILAGLVLPLAAFGYITANVKMLQEAYGRQKTLEQVKSTISKGVNEPNDEYSIMLAHINENYEKWVDEVLVDVWKHQQERMTWPPFVGDVPKGMLGEFSPNARVVYKRKYMDLIHDLEKEVLPVMPKVTSREAIGNFETASGKIISNVPWKQQVILAAHTPQARFGEFTISSIDMWNAQIDIWLTRLLYDAVRKTNADKESISDSIIRRIDRLELLGGTGEPALTGSQLAGMNLDMNDPNISSQVTSFLGGGGVMVPTQVAFSAEQEFGPEYPESEGGDGGIFGGGAPAPSVEIKPLRYIAESESDPFVQRGFYLSVIILQNKIDDFLVMLADSPWPTRVERFSVGLNPYREEGTGAGGRRLTGIDTSKSINELISQYGIPQDMMPPGMAGMSGMGSMASQFLGGGRRRAKREKLEGLNELAKNLPPFAESALEHSDLVQLNLCGVITMYKEPTEVLAKLAPAGDASQQAALDSAAAAETAPPAASPTTPPKEERVRFGE